MSATSSSAAAPLQVLGACSLNLAPLPGQTTRTQTIPRHLDAGERYQALDTVSANVTGLWSATLSWQTSTAAVRLDVADAPGGASGPVVATSSSTGGVTSLTVCWTGQRAEQFSVWVSSSVPQTLSLTITAPTV